MKILNYGSLNIDHVYNLHHFVRPGETMDSDTYSKFCGGKGLNQSIALANAGAKVYHAGKVGEEGDFLIKKLEDAGVITKDIIKETTSVCGHAIIQVNKEGENNIILYGGANRKIGKEDVEKTLSRFNKGDFLILQNEISNIDFIIKKAKFRGMRIILNPAPMNEEVFTYPLELVDIFVVNEIEGYEMTKEKEPEKIISVMQKKFPKATIVLTLGAKGMIYAREDDMIFQEADTGVQVIDTTAAGDTFIGFFIASLARKMTPKKSLEIAAKACALCVAKAGASSSIPTLEEIENKE